MTASSDKPEALRRLLAINWTPIEGGQKSHVALIREYLRRAALWAKSLQATEYWPFFDVANFLAPEGLRD